MLITPQTSQKASMVNICIKRVKIGKGRGLKNIEVNKMLKLFALILFSITL